MPTADLPTLSRRGLLAGAALLAGAVTPRAVAATLDLAATTPVGAAPLRLAPPVLTDPIRHEITPTTRVLNLTAGDHLVVLPATPVTGTLTIEGQDVARNIVVIGGAVAPAPAYDPATLMATDVADYAVYTQTGFTGATGGTFRIQLMEKTYRVGIAPPVTAPLAWNAGADEIRAAINASLNAYFGDTAGGCLAVVGSGAGGPWKVVPENNSRLGRVDLLLDGLAGTPVKTRTNQYRASTNAFVIKRWRGVAHVEGLSLGSADTNDGINVDNANADARLQLANIHSEGRFHVFHNDWIHADGLQSYRGPAQFHLERCDFVSNGGNGFIGQPATVSGLQNLYDWWYEAVHFRAERPDDDPYRLDIDPAAAYFTLVNTEWRQVMNGCFASFVSRKTGAEITNTPDNRFNAGGRIEPVAGLTLRQRPPGGWFCDPARGQCGVGYVSPGYDRSLAAATTTLRFVGGVAVR